MPHYEDSLELSLRPDELAAQIDTLSSNVRAMADALRGAVSRDQVLAYRDAHLSRDGAVQGTDACSTAIASRQELARFARRYLRMRRLRDTIFPPGIFADPCWDLMLDLYASAAERGLISVSSACIAAAVPATTALRHIGTLEAEGHVLRSNDPDDRRRAYLRLSPDMINTVEQWLIAMFRGVDTSET